MKRTLLTRIKNTLLATFALVMVASSVPAYAAGVNVFSGCNNSGGAGGSASSSAASSSTVCGAAQQDDFGKLMSNVINTILVVLGMIAVIMIVIGGIRYTTSNGDSSQIKAAKDTILYAVVGLVIAILAYAIVNFVLASFKK